MKGRKQTPSAIYDLHGNRGRRPRTDQKSAGVAGVPARPEWLSKAAAEIWDNAITWLGVDLGVLTRGDQTVLALYCDAAAEYEAVVHRLRQAGRIYVSQSKTTRHLPDGTVVETVGGLLIKMHPYVAQQNELRRRLQSLAAELGLSPVARLRAAAAAGGDSSRMGIGGFLGRK